MQVPAIVQVKSLDTPLHYSGPSTVWLFGGFSLTSFFRRSLAYCRFIAYFCFLNGFVVWLLPGFCFFGTMGLVWLVYFPSFFRLTVFFPFLSEHYLLPPCILYMVGRWVLVVVFYKAYPGLGKRSIFYPGSSAGSTITFGIVEDTSSNPTSNISFKRNACACVLL